jgi:hypothetical protein
MDLPQDPLLTDSLNTVDHRTSRRILALHLELAEVQHHRFLEPTAGELTRHLRLPLLEQVDATLEVGHPVARSRELQTSADMVLVELLVRRELSRCLLIVCIQRRQRFLLRDALLLETGAIPREREPLRHDCNIRAAGTSSPVCQTNPAPPTTALGACSRRPAMARSVPVFTPACFTSCISAFTPGMFAGDTLSSNPSTSKRTEESGSIWRLTRTMEDIVRVGADCACIPGAIARTAAERRRVSALGGETEYGIPQLCRMASAIPVFRFVGRRASATTGSVVRREQAPS